MPETHGRNLGDAAALAFESLAFVLAEVADPAPAAEAGTPDGVAVVAFSGQAHGALIAEVSGGILQTLAANMLGLETLPGDVEQRDALGEIANVIAGQVLPRVAGPTAVFTLAPPRTHRSWADAVAAVGAPTSVVHFQLDEGRSRVGLVWVGAA